MTTSDAAERLGVSRRRINYLIKNGQLEADKNGRDYWITENQLARVKIGKAGRPQK